jgi:hypothetical protein
MHKIVQFLSSILQAFYIYIKVIVNRGFPEYGKLKRFLQGFGSDLYKGKSLESREIKGIYNLDYLRELQ